MTKKETAAAYSTFWNGGEWKLSDLYTGEAAIAYAESVEDNENVRLHTFSDVAEAERCYEEDSCHYECA